MIHSKDLPRCVALVRLLADVSLICLLAGSARIGIAQRPNTVEAPPASEQVASERSALVNRFLGQYCIDCHSSDSPEGERAFDSFGLPIVTEGQLIAADEIIDQVTLKQMPPEDVEQPSDDERVALVTALRESILQARSVFEGNQSRTVLRRLSNREYENTLTTLFGRRVDTLGLTAEFPKEDASESIDTIGASLVTSGFLLDQYFQAANRLVELRLGKIQMEPQEWHFKDNFVQYEELNGPHRSALNFEYLCLYEQPNTDTRQGGYGHIEDFLDGVPVSGLYDIEVNAQAMHRDTHYDPDIFHIDFSEPFQLAVVPGDVTKGHIHYPQAIEPILAQAIVPDEEPEWIRFQVWLEAGQTPRFIFPNGPYESRASVIEVNKRYKDEFKDPKDGVSRVSILREGALPHIRIGEIKIRGPIAETGGSAEEVAVFGESGFQPESALEQLYGFAQRAYRRPLVEADRERIESLYSKRVAEKASARQAALDTVKLVLCSPSFLYLSEVTPEDEKNLNPFDLATRLSYALWTAPPDDTLFELAQSGELLDDKVLRSQIERLLNDPRSDSFITGFLDAWLNLKDIGNLPPPRKSARAYYAENLPKSMKREAHEFFRHVLKTNGTIVDFLDSDYTFVDKNLARHYDLPEKETLTLADGFQRVSLAENTQRGGVLGMAGVLTVSANGVDTSPVTRGVWVLENILGDPPPPPPDEVPSIDSDVRGATTIRERLEKHSQDQTCNVCHRKIDPMGFALETFDPTGRWREKYPSQKGRKRATIDTTGKLPSGESYDGFQEFKSALVSSRHEAFTRHLVSQLLSYSTGRHMESADRYEINDIVDRLQSEDLGLRSLVFEVLTSQIFRSR